MNIFIYTLGCRLNQCESEAIASSFYKAGFEMDTDGNNADLIIVNSCTVTSKAEQKVRRMIRKFSSSEKCEVILVTGCYAQLNRKILEKVSDKVIVIGLDKKADILKLPDFIKENDVMSLYENCSAFSKFVETEDCSVFDYHGSNFIYHSRAYLKIQDGCDNECAYCRVHVARGKSSSLDSDEVVKRALELEKNNYHEIMLTGVNLTMYDHEREGLGALIEKLLAALGPNIRLRLSSMEPDHVDDRLLSTLKDPRIQPHFHIPIQSASNKVLKRANRHYDNEHLKYIIKRLREVKENPFIACDLISGLPQEEEEEAQETYDFVKENNFSRLHVFPFSPRPDTPFFGVKDRCCEDIRDQRAKKLRDLSDELYLNYVNSYLGKEVEVLLEQDKGKFWWGTTGNFLKVKVFGLNLEAKKGEIYKVKIRKDYNGKAIEVDLV
ncbi:MAG: tRNA (N(6)-L-threonylcarbamoyladenosine(37)-C(2))-methylthiotransferase MtaB [Sphaerochaetaceae bacterium]|nr:tRNA (N(6)-L-threonylcarbamoyladenosine(37)-C(2))-methylthiotransferase MtaB [Sphaerochaetaceae bacterium]